MPEFALQFDPTNIPSLARSYGPEQDRDVFAAGRRIRCGNYERSDVETIFRWKTGGRGISRLRRNSSEEIADALSLAIHARTERAAIAVLVGLEGVHVPVASAILTAAIPERYTVIDFRALESLGNMSSDRSIKFLPCLP